MTLVNLIRGAAEEAEDDVRWPHIDCYTTHVLSKRGIGGRVWHKAASLRGAGRTAECDGYFWYVTEEPLRGAQEGKYFPDLVIKTTDGKTIYAHEWAVGLWRLGGGGKGEHEMPDMLSRGYFIEGLLLTNNEIGD